MIRLTLSSGTAIVFDNFVDLFDYVLERMCAAGEL